MSLMLILHAAVEGRDCLLWAETSPASTEPRLAIPKHRKPKTAGPPPAATLLPYGADVTSIVMALEAIDGVTEAGRCEVLPATIWLPTVDGQPLASSPLIAPSRRTPVAGQ